MVLNGGLEIKSKLTIRITCIEPIVKAIKMDEITKRI